jgi:hypothetical protein
LIHFNGTSKPTEISKQFEFSVATEQDFIKAKAKFKDKLTQDTINFPKINGEIKLLIEGNKPTQLSLEIHYYIQMMRTLESINMKDNLNK